MESGRGGVRIPGEGKKLGRPQGSAKDPALKVESKQIRLSLDAMALAEAEAQRRGGKATARSVIEDLIHQHIGGLS